jgi:hypothetical protein
MDIGKLLAEMRSERDKIDRAIRALEQLSVVTPKRQSGPPTRISEGRARRTVGGEANQRPADSL